MPAATRKEKIAILSGSSLFSQLGPALLEPLADAARLTLLPRRQDLFHRGDPAGHVYVVVSGTLKVLTTSAEADDVVVSLLSSGDVIGEIAAFAQCNRTATVRSIDDCQLLAIDRRDFLAALRRQPELAIRLLELLARRLKGLTEFVEDTLFLNLPHRLARQIEHLAERCGRRTEQGIRIDLPLSQEEWGDLVGATREAVNKQLSEWRAAKILSFENRLVTVHDLAAIHRIAEEAAP